MLVSVAKAHISTRHRTFEALLPKHIGMEGRVFENKD